MVQEEYPATLVSEDAVGIYTHPGPEKWSESDHSIAKKHIAAIPGLKTLLAGMHRTGYKGAEADFSIDGVTVFNTLTF